MTCGCVIPPPNCGKRYCFLSQFCVHEQCTNHHFPSYHKCLYYASDKKNNYFEQVTQNLKKSTPKKSKNWHIIKMSYDAVLPFRKAWLLAFTSYFHGDYSKHLQLISRGKWLSAVPSSRTATAKWLCWSFTKGRIFTNASCPCFTFFVWYTWYPRIQHLICSW